MRQKDVPKFFGVSRETFNKRMRPYLTEIPLGSSPQSGIVYDIGDLNALADIIKERKGRPAKKGGNIKWDVIKVAQDLKLKKEMIPLAGRSKAPCTEDELDKVLAQAMKQ